MQEISGVSPFAHLWTLDPQVAYLNHGSFGACPRHILEKQQEYRNRLENEPIRFLMQEAEPLLYHSREKVAGMMGAQTKDVVFVGNATSGVNTVFRSLKFSADDEILFTNHSYGACRKALEFVSYQSGARLVEAKYPFPIASPDVIIDAVLAMVTPRTKIALIDHITSATALVHPLDSLVKELESRGIAVMIDGAHALGSIPLDLDRLGASYYTANCHKWLCAPKGAAILHVREDKQNGIFPLVISHAGHDAGSFAERFFWPGTWDPSAFICVADVIDFMATLLPEGWPAIMERNRRFCLDARRLICNSLEIGLPCPDEMIASMASFPLPPSTGELPHNYKSFSVLQERLYEEFKIEIPVWNWEHPESRLTRIAVQLYNSPEQYVLLGHALKGLMNVAGGSKLGK